MKRGTSGLSLVVGVNKPVGMSSHDVVNKVRGIFGEKRVGHTGTLDPLAEGVLPICVGPATRLDKYMVGHDKTYRATIAFGAETNTCDAEGAVVQKAPVSPALEGEAYARAALAGLLGKQMQVPPAYCAVKIKGKPAYERVRAGEDVQIEPREVEIYRADLVRIELGEYGAVSWIVDLSVSKGTYIRSIARDLGRALGTCAHMSALQRLRAGRISIDECVSLESLADLGVRAALDPVRVLGFRYAFVDDQAAAAQNGNPFAADALALYEPLPPASDEQLCACSTTIVRDFAKPRQGELAIALLENRMKAIYRFEAARGLWMPDCVFSVGVSRG